MPKGKLAGKRASTRSSGDELELKRLVEQKVGDVMAEHDGEARMTLAQAFELGDSDDRERVVRAVALLLDRAGDSNLPEDQLQTLSRGLANVLYDIAKDISWEKIRRARGEGC